MRVELKPGDWVIWMPKMANRVAQVVTCYSGRSSITIRLVGEEWTHPVHRGELRKISERRGLTLAAAELLGV